MNRTAARGKLLFLLLAGLLCLPLPSQAEPALRTFTAHYQVKFHGLSGGVIELTLSKGETAGTYVYSSRARPSFLGSFMVSADARESSTMELAGDHIRPLEFVSDDGKKGDAKDSALQFDWSKRRLSGKAEGQALDLELSARAQDHQSIQIAVMWELLQNREPGIYQLIDGSKLKEYEYKRAGAAKMQYEGRDIETTLVRSERTGGSDRITTYWHAPEFGYMPIRAERTTKGKVDLVMQMTDFKFND